MLRWTPRAVLDSEEEYAGAAKQVTYKESYTVTYWETFTVDGGTVTFCVKHWPATASVLAGQPQHWPERYEITVHCCLGGLPDNAGLRRPVLLWDVEGSVPFNWTPPTPLPAIEGVQHQVDFTQKCMVTQFATQVASRGWKLSLMWLLPSQGPAPSLPSVVTAVVQTHDGRRLVHPVSGKSFHIPLLGSPPDSRPGPPPPMLDLRVLAAAPACPNLSQEFAEARRDLERQLSQQQQNQALLVEREREETELERQVSQLPALELLSEIQSNLDEEIAHRQRCQNELLDLRPWPRLLCELQQGAELVGEHGIVRRSRSEVSLPSLRQSFDFDVVVEPGSCGSGDELWNEARPVLDSALRSSASYACVFLASSVSLGGQSQRALAARMVDHFFECVADVPKTSDSSVEAALTMIEMGPDSTGFYNLLQDGPMERCVAPKLVEDSMDGSLVVQELNTLSLRTREEVLAAQNAGATRRSKWHGHSVMSICAQRHDSSTGEVAKVMRLVIVEMGTLPDSVGASGAATPAIEHSPVVQGNGKTSSCGKQLATVAKVAQACIERTSDTCGVASRSLAAPAAALQAKIVIIASVSPQLGNLQDSLNVLQLAPASTALQERLSAKQDDSNSRRQLAKLMQENQRLRTELSERGRPSQVEPADSEMASPRVGHDSEMASPIPQSEKASPCHMKLSCMSTPNVRSPRDRLERERRTALAVANTASPTKWGCRDSRTPDQPRRKSCGRRQLSSAFEMTC